MKPTLIPLLVLLTACFHMPTPKATQSDPSPVEAAQRMERESPGTSLLENKGPEILTYENNGSIIEGVVRRRSYVRQYGNADGGIDTGTFIYYILQLDQDITVIASTDDQFNETTHASEVHIFGENIQLEDYLDENIKIRGTFWSRHTWHHKRPLIFQIDAVLPFSENGETSN